MRTTAPSTNIRPDIRVSRASSNTMADIAVSSSMPATPAKTGQTSAPAGGMHTHSSTSRLYPGNHHARYAPAQPMPYSSTLVNTQKLPGPMSTNLLGNYGALQPLDNICAYLPQYSKSLFGRSAIMANLVPHRTVACGATAAWVWLGGAFPESIDIISNSHYRSMTYGRRIHTYNRKATPEQTSTIGGLTLTTPARTACDVMVMDAEASHTAEHSTRSASSDSPDGSEDANAGNEGLQDYRSQARETTCTLIQEFHFSPEECLAILDANRMWPGAAQAHRFFTTIRYCF